MQRRSCYKIIRMAAKCLPCLMLRNTKGICLQNRIFLAGCCSRSGGMRILVGALAAKNIGCFSLRSLAYISFWRCLAGLWVLFPMMAAELIVWLILLGVVMLALIIPTWACIVRRLHDQDKSGWFALLTFIPYLGGFVLLVFMCIDRTPYANRYGDDPKGRN